MSILVVQFAPRPRLRSQTPGPAASESARPSREFSYALSADGLTLTSQGRCGPTLLPKADTVIAVIADTDVSWHRITLPKAPAARLRSALVGVLEEGLLDEEDALHLAVAPEAIAGQPTWVATVRKSWLAGEIAALEGANLRVDRVVPSSWPDDPPSAHFFEAEEESGARAENINLAWSDSHGVTCMRLDGGLARTQLPADPQTPLRASATPAVAAAAERWLGAPVALLPPADRALLAARSLWNLRQFDLAPRHRGTRALLEAWRAAMSPAWRAVRVGVAALVLLNIVGLNLWAWHLRGVDSQRQQAMHALLRATYPNALTNIAPDVEMERQTSVLRTSAGKAGSGDLEAMMQVAADAWPDGMPPVESLRFEPGRLTLAATGWNPAQIDRFRSELRPGGWSVDAAEGRVTIGRAGGVSP
jgi:general secretion pathway protein L